MALEVAVIRNENPAFIVRDGQHLVIGDASRIIRTYSRGIMAKRGEEANQRAG